MIYSSLITILLNKDSFFRFKDYIKPHIVPKEIFSIVRGLEEYYKRDSSIEDISLESFITWYKLVKISGLSKEEHSLYDKIFSSLESSSSTEEETKRVLEFLLEKDYSMKIADHAIKVSEGDGSKSVLELEEMLESYKTESGKILTDDVFEDSSIEDILSHHLSDGLDWRLEELNLSLGPLRAGDFVMITSRPDSGKTTALCSEMSYMLQQLPEDKDLFWANNEETARKVKSRFFQALLAKTKKEIDSDILGYKMEIEKLINPKRFKFYNNKDMKVADVEAALKKCNPGLIVFDQLWKVSGFKESFSEADKMTKLFGWGRSLAEKYNCPVITVHQADGTAHGQAYIEMNQLYNSRTGIQGEMDAIVGIGRSFDPSVAENTRFLHISKNKMDGGGRSDEKFRNGKFQIEIQPHIARFKGVY